MADDTYSRGYRNDPNGRGGTGAPGQPTDPLTELARLIGQSDPFAPGPGRDRRPDPRAPENPAPQDWQGNESANPPQYQDRQDHYAPHAHPDDGYGGASEPHYADNSYRSRDGYPPAEGGHAPGPYDPGYAAPRGYGDQRYHDDPSDQGGAHVQSGVPAYEAGPRGGHQDDGEKGYEAPYFGAAEHGPGQDDDFYEEEPARRRRGGLITVAALVGLAVIGTAGAFAYRTVFTGPAGAPPVIRSEGGPNKIVPAVQNNDSASNKQIYDRIGDRGQNERVVPREEQPLNIPDPARAAAPSGPFAALPGGPPAQPNTSAAAPPAGPGEPKKIRTVTIKADQPPGEAMRPAAPPRAVPPPQVAPPRAGASASASPNAPLSLAPNDSASAAAPPPAPPARVAHAAPPPRAPAPVSAPATSGANGGFFVQLSAQKTEEEAQSSFRGIQARYASVLSGRQAVIRRKDLGSKGVFYGAQVGPFSREDAVQLCDSLKSAGGSCMIQRN